VFTLDEAFSFAFSFTFSFCALYPNSAAVAARTPILTFVHESASFDPTNFSNELTSFSCLATSSLRFPTERVAF